MDMTKDFIELIQKHCAEVIFSNIFKHALRSETNFSNWKPFKNEEKSFLFYFSFSRYLDFWLHFLVMQKNKLIRKIKLILKFMTITTWLKNN